MKIVKEVGTFTVSNKHAFAAAETDNNVVLFLVHYWIVNS
jgi:hypothetical protein